MNATDRVLQRCAVAAIHVRQNAKSPWTTPLILQLVDLYGRGDVLKAMREALHYHTVDAAYVESLVVQARRKASLPSPTTVQPKRKELIQLELEIPDPGRYDRFTQEDDDE